MIEVIYGVKSRSMDEAKTCIEAATGRNAVGRNGHHGGDYYSFEKEGITDTVRDGEPEDLKIVNNVDFDDIDYEDGGLREPEHPEYPFIVHLDATSERSPRYLGLEAQPTRFVKLRETPY